MVHNMILVLWAYSLLVNSVPDIKFFDSLIGWTLANAGNATLEQKQSLFQHPPDIRDTTLEPASYCEPSFTCSYSLGHQAMLTCTCTCRQSNEIQIHVLYSRKLWRGFKFGNVGGLGAKHQYY